MLANDIRYDTPLYIRELQSALRDIHFLYPNEIPLINIDGIFGPETTEVILAAQRLGGREATGIVDYETWMWPFAVRRNGIRNKASIKVLGKAVPLDSEIDTVRTVETMFTALSRVFTNLPAHAEQTALDRVLGEFADLVQIDSDRVSREEILQLLVRLYAVYTL